MVIVGKHSSSMAPSWAMTSSLAFWRFLLARHIPMIQITPSTWQSKFCRVSFLMLLIDIGNNLPIRGSYCMITGRVQYGVLGEKCNVTSPDIIDRFR